jgi:replicative superfamily II helicase
MKGRAGRKGKDTYGESFLCFTKNDKDGVMKIVNGEMPAISSRLGLESKGFERVLLEAISANLATSQTAIEMYATWTLFFRQTGYKLLVTVVDCRDVDATLETLRRATTCLLENGLVEAIVDGFTQAGGALKPTTLGKAIVTSALSVDEGLFVHRELDRSMRSFILDDELVSLLQQKLTEASYIPLYPSIRPM